MRRPSFRHYLSAILLVFTPAAVWAHPALFEGGLMASLVHLLTQPDHLLLLGGVGLAAGIAIYITNRSSLRGDDDDENHS